MPTSWNPFSLENRMHRIEKKIEKMKNIEEVIDNTTKKILKKEKDEEESRFLNLYIKAFFMYPEETEKKRDQMKEYKDALLKNFIATSPLTGKELKKQKEIKKLAFLKESRRKYFGLTDEEKMEKMKNGFEEIIFD